MKIVTTISAVRDQIRQWRQEGLTIGYVPTMGYLHEGHGSLMKAAGENDRVVASIFVNPMQFGPNEDLDSYPRDLEKDAAYCESLGVDLIFHPDAQEMYAPGFCSYVDVNGLTDNLCGASRPVHFRGVCTVVSKFFNIIQPDVAYRMPSSWRSFVAWSKTSTCPLPLWAVPLCGRLTAWPKAPVMPT